MEAQTLKAEVRKVRGKGPARQLRMRGLIPAVFYGPGKEPTSLQLDPVELSRLLSGPFGRNQVIELDIGGTKELTLVRDLEVSPVGRAVLHADFYAIAMEREVRAIVPFETKGRALGVQKGGKLKKVYRDLPVVATPDKIPASIVYDVVALDLGASVRVKDLVLPPGARVDHSPERVVVTLIAKEVQIEEEATPGAPGAAAAAAPAKDAKDAKKK